MNTSRATRLIAPIGVALALLLTGCSASPVSPPAADPTDTPGTPHEQPTTQPTEQPPVLDPLDPALVGTWSVSAWQDSTGSHTLSESYTFTAEGLYEYTFAECRSSTDCSILSHEQGYAQSAEGVLSLAPQTPSDDGPRAWPYEVGYLDPELTISLELHLLYADGTVQQIFYGNP
jgi:hypothetical protein